MPTYQYKCPACGNLFEEFQSMSEAPLESCPQCGEKPERLISGGAGLIFKGSGFYITDYRSNAYKSAASNDTRSGDSRSGESGSSAPASTPSASTPSAPAASGSSSSSTPAPAASKPAEKTSKKSES